MKHKPLHGSRFFFATAPLPCPYLPGRIERRVVTELVGRDVTTLHDALSQAGYRRSHTIAYAPVCPECSACVAVRIVVADFTPSRSQQRVMRLNEDLSTLELPPAATSEQFALFSAYQKARHGDGDMSRMDYLDYQALVEETPVDTVLGEFRRPDGSLAAVCLADRLDDGLSAVYSFFDPRLSRRSPGTHMILWLVERAKSLGLAYVYLGFWIEGCSKMSYKANFAPVEGFTHEGWQRLDAGNDT